MKNLFTIILSLIFNIISAQSIDLPLEDIILKHVTNSIDSCNINLTKSIKNPDNRSQTLLIVPKIIEGSTSEQYYVYRINILLLNESLELMEKYIDSTKYYSDAIFLRELKFEDTNYQINDNTKVFGVLFTYEANSRLNPYESTKLNLYSVKNNVIRKLLNEFELTKGTGEINNSSSNYISTKRIIIPVNSKTNHKNDFMVKEKKIIYNTENEEDKTLESDFKKIGLLSFDNIKGQYIFNLNN